MKKRRVLMVSIFMLLLLGLFAAPAMAAGKTGWIQKGKKIYYYSPEGENQGEKVKGLWKIGKKTYYFDKWGILKTGWIQTEDGYRYFKPTGKIGDKGSMYTGFKTIGKDKFYFEKNGVVATGMRKVSKQTYFFSTSKTLGVRGKAVKNCFKNWKGKRYYFGEKGTMLKNTWVKKYYYMGKDGAKLVNTVTPDGYLVDENGKKVGTTKVNGWVKIQNKWKYYVKRQKRFLEKEWKTVNGKRYYLDADGVRVTGWQNIGKNRYHFTSQGVMQKGLVKIGSKTYYFNDRGQLQRNTEVDGYVVDENGVATKDPNSKPKILVIAGHGQGDPGATSTWGYESNYTRQFAKLIVKELKKSGKVDVTYYKNGSTSYDCYQQNAKTLGSSGANISSLITGKGNAKNRVKTALKRNPNLPSFTDYDYVLEIHFNAMGSGKNPQGNGSYTGIGFYINNYKNKYTLERNILSKIVRLGFKQWGSGVFASSGLFNARVCQELGVSYGLLETAFIDDGDDMRFYTKNKSKMAKAVSDAIVDYYS